MTEKLGIGYTPGIALEGASTSIWIFLLRGKYINEKVSTGSQLQQVSK